MVGAAAPLEAQIAGLPTPFVSGSAEVWTGVNATRHAWSSYGGVNWAPLGKLEDDGFRLRVAGGYGEYRYSGTVAGLTQTIYGSAGFADLLAGYQVGLGALTLKAFAGATFDDHVLTPFDASNPVSGSARGVKAAIEGWLNVTSLMWAQFDASYATAHRSYNTRLRLGYRVTPAISVGVEGGALGNAASDSGRGGGFVRYEWRGGEISASGGVSGDIAAPRNAYGTLVYLTRF
jgi:hypothetical protein